MGTISRNVKAGGSTNVATGQTIAASDLNTDMNTAFTEINGEIDDSNVKTGELPGAKSLRFTEMSDPAAASSNDILLYASDEGGLTTFSVRDSASPIANLPYYVKDLTEATTATGAAADIKTVTVNIPVSTAFRVGWTFRKTTGAASAPTMGLKVNATQVFANTAVCSATNQAENGSMFSEWISPRSSASYLRPGARLIGLNWIGGSPVSAAIGPTLDYPNATITSLVITGSSVSASITLAVADVFVEIQPA